jgi:hypothetical protein
MDTVALTHGLNLVIGIMALVGIANFVDFGFRTMALGRAKRAEALRLQKWGLPAPIRAEQPRLDEHLWHLSTLEGDES